MWPQLLWRKNDFGKSENWEYSSVPNGGCFEATVRWADQLTVKDLTSFLVILVLQQLNNLDHICSSDDLDLVSEGSCNIFFSLSHALTSMCITSLGVKKIVVIIRVFPGKTRIGGHRVNFNEMTQNCLNRKSPGQVVKVMRRQFSCSLDLEFYDTRLISTSSHKGIFSLWHQKRPQGNPLCRHPPFPEIPLAYWGPRCR